MRGALILITAVCLAGQGCDGDTADVVDGAVPDLAPPDLAAPDLALPDLAPPDLGPPDMSPDTGAALTLKAGAATVDITPVKGVPLAGYGGAPRRVISAATIPAHLAAALGACYDPTPGDVASLFAPSKGKLDPIAARVLVLDNGKTMAAFIKLDTIGVSRKLRDDLEASAKSLGIPKQNLIVSASHTHSGPGAVSEQKIWELIAADCLDAFTYTKMLNGIKSALIQAASNLSPAKIGLATTTEKRVSKNRMDKPGKFDPELGLIKVEDASTGKPIAALFNFALHPTCFGGSNFYFSADWVGAAETAIEKKLGGGVAIHINGAEGDVAPKMGGTAGIKFISEIMAATVSSLWTKTTTNTWIDIQGDFADVKMPSPKFNGCMPLFGTTLNLCSIIPLAKNLPLDLFMQKVLPFTALRLGDAVFAALPGEGATDVGLAIKAAGKVLGFKHTFVAGLSNDYMGYIVTKADFYNGSYEAQATMYGENTAKLVVDALKARMTKIKPTSSP